MAQPIATPSATPWSLAVVEGMELWRPDWFKLDPSTQDMRANELVTITRGTAKVAIACCQMAMEQDYYHTTGAAERELRRVLD